MPGIVGLISRKPRAEAEAELLQMIEALRHESFYVTGTWIEESLGIYVGWVARNNSFAAEMPVRNGRRNVVLVFAGEEFSKPASKCRLGERGCGSDAVGPHYLVDLYEEEPNFPANLNGKFQGLLVDLRDGTAKLFNDRYGMERLSYHQSNDAFYFAPESKAILTVRPELRRLNKRSAGEFIACGAVLENRTMFEEILALPPGSVWTFRNASLEQKAKYFHPSEWESQAMLDPETFYREFQQAFASSLPRYFSGQEPVAMSLTGGLDTRMIMAWQRSEPGFLPCYTFGSMFRENHDVRVARRVAKVCNQPFQVITSGREFLSQFAHYAERAVYLGEGCVDVSRSPDVYVNEQARRIAPVRMTGNYGGEVLRGVRTFKPVEPLPGLFSSGIHSFVHQAKQTYAEISTGHPVSFAVFKQCPWNHYGIFALEQTQLALRSPFLDNDLVRTVFRAPASALAANDVSLRLISHGKKELLEIPTDRGLTGDRKSLSVAAHRAFLEFQFKAEYAYDMGMPQWVARVDHAFSGLHLERLVLGRHKVFHFRIWYRDALAAYVREMLLDPITLRRPYIERRRLEEVVQGHLTGDRNYTNEIHKVLTLEILHRLFLDNPGTHGFQGRPRVVPADAKAAY